MISKSLRLTIAIASSAVLAVVGLVAAQDCDSCKPTKFSPFPSWTGTVSVCIESSLSNHENDLKTGFNYWKSTLNAVGYGIDFSFSSSASCQSAINVKSDSAVSFPFAALASPSGGIGINPGIINSSDPQFNSDFWKSLGGHEMGHVMGYHDTPPACWPFSIMSANHAPTIALPGTPLCSDTQAAGNDYVNPNTGGNYSEPSQYQEDCWDVYLVISIYQQQWNGQTNTLTITQVGTIDWFLYTDCSGSPPI